MLRRFYQTLLRREARAGAAEPPPPPSPQMAALLDALTRLEVLTNLDRLHRLVPPFEPFPPNWEQFAQPLSPIADAFHHTIVLDSAGEHFVVVRIGGIAGVYERYQGNMRATLAQADGS